MAFRRSIPLAALAAAVSLAAAPAAGAAESSSYPGWAPDVPWGAGCEPAQSAALRTASNCGATLANGEAVPPPGAPSVVKRVIAAANEIDRRPYVWGGGHASFISRGYDCSGAVSYALHGAGLLAYTQVSGQLAHYGDPGPGRWITIYANAEHVFMVVAGLRFDTRNDPEGVSGPRWKMAAPESQILPKFAVRHPAGL
ncbi:MAG: C40 family peptidase [Actinobacteria bacterium]|nr:C40 family peptidase [Actinomycetota bacterium]